MLGDRARVRVLVGTRMACACIRIHTRMCSFSYNSNARAQDAAASCNCCVRHGPSCTHLDVCSKKSFFFFQEKKKMPYFFYKSFHVHSFARPLHIRSRFIGKVESAYSYSNMHRMCLYSYTYSYVLLLAQQQRSSWGGSYCCNCCVQLVSPYTLTFVLKRN